MINLDYQYSQSTHYRAEPLLAAAAAAANPVSGCIVDLVSERAAALVRSLYPDSISWRQRRNMRDDYLSSHMWELFDSNRDGKIDFEKFVSAQWAKLLAEAPEGVHCVTKEQYLYRYLGARDDTNNNWKMQIGVEIISADYDVIDRDRKGYIIRTDFSRPMLRDFRILDKDGDGFITQGEFHVKQCLPLNKPQTNQPPDRITSLVIPGQTCKEPSSYHETDMVVTSKPFNIQQLERLPDSISEDIAQTLLNDFFPVGSPTKNFETYFSGPQKLCVRGRDPRPVIACQFHVNRLSIVSTDWIIGAYTDEGGEIIESTFASRNLTGP